MNKLLISGIGAVLLGGFCQSASADTLGNSRAVSAPNGKVEINGGWDGSTTNPGSFDFNGAAAFAAPIGNDFGFQGDVAAGQFAGAMNYSASAHVFTRNPDSYLLGIVGGGAWSANASTYVVGPEAELYAGPFTIDGSAGFVAKSVSGVSSNTFFAAADLKYYPTPNLKLELGAADFDNSKTAHLGMEWQVSDSQPLSLSTTGTVGDNNFLAANVGVTYYFGGLSNTLIDRHRHEDPANFSRLLVFYNGAYQYVNVANGSVVATNAGGTCPAGYVLNPIGCVPISK